MIKLAISFVKYCPQVFLNFRRKSTIGWNIWNVLLDFTGGLLSVAQLIFDSWRKGDWGGITGDPVKFGLGFISMAFDLIFMFQHYVLYRHSNSATKERWSSYKPEDEHTERLLGDDHKASSQQNSNGNIQIVPKRFE